MLNFAEQSLLSQSSCTCDTAGARTDPTKIRLHYESGKQSECGEPVGYWPSRTGELLTDGLRKDLRPTSGD